MLPRKFRLTADKDIDAVFRRGKGAGAGGLSVRARSNGKDHSRFAFVVSTKVSKKAVVRNRLKRQLREIVHGRLKDLKPGHDVVVLSRKEVLDRDFADLDVLLTKLLKRSGLLG